MKRFDERNEEIDPVGPVFDIEAVDGPVIVMGVLNVTPDSFSDGGEFFDRSTAVEHGLRMVEEGAGIIDVGGESTRPYSQPVSDQEEMDRVVPVVEAIASRTGAVLSVDTTKASVASEAVKAGATVVNDISGLQFDDRMADVVAQSGAYVVLMHIQGTPETMQIHPEYGDVVEDVKAFFRERTAYALERGIPERRIILDPGIGFGKTAAHNLELLDRLEEFRMLNRPLLLGTSRKSFIGKITGVEKAELRDYGTAATVAIGIYKGVRIVRVHNVQAARQTAAVAWAVRRRTIGTS